MSAHATEARQSFGLSVRRLMCIRIAAGLGLALCVYLAFESFRNMAPAGCDPSAGCGRLLSGRWSGWFGLPVSVPAFLVYFGILVSTCFVKSEDRTWRFKYGGRFLAMSTALAAGAGIWFVIVHVAQRVFCPYCLILHTCGVFAAGLVWQRLRRWPRQLLTPVGAGLAILILGQTVVFRQPYRVQADVVSVPQSTQPAIEPSLHVRIVAGGRLFDLDPERLPVLGSRHARHFLVLMSDYTCEHCRTTHRMLERSLGRFGDQVGVIVLPVVLDPAANPYLPDGVVRPLPQDHALTRLAISVFCANPSAFAEMNRWLFAEDHVRNQPEAREHAVRLIGAEALLKAEQDPRVQQITLTGCELFARTGNGMLPKMLIGATQISGTVGDVSAILPTIERAWGPPRLSGHR